MRSVDHGTGYFSYHNCTVGRYLVACLGFRLGVFEGALFWRIAARNWPLKINLHKSTTIKRMVVPVDQPIKNVVGLPRYIYKYILNTPPTKKHRPWKLMVGKTTFPSHKFFVFPMGKADSPPHLTVTCEAEIQCSYRSVWERQFLELCIGLVDQVDWPLGDLGLGWWAVQVDMGLLKAEDQEIR